MLVGPAGTDFDLRLEKFVNEEWISVSLSLSSDSIEEISYTNATRGFYRFVVVSYRGSGTYQFGYDESVDLDALTPDRKSVV